MAYIIYCSPDRFNNSPNQPSAGNVTPGLLAVTVPTAPPEEDSKSQWYLNSGEHNSVADRSSMCALANYIGL